MLLIYFLCFLFLPVSVRHSLSIYSLSILFLRNGKRGITPPGEIREFSRKLQKVANLKINLSKSSLKTSNFFIPCPILNRDKTPT